MPPSSASVQVPTQQAPPPPSEGNPPLVQNPPTAVRIPTPVQQAPPLPPRGNPLPAQNPPAAVQVPALIQQAPPPPLGGNPPPTPNPPTANMAAAPPRAIGTTPDAFNGNLTKAKSFWNALENYYTLNNAVYADEGQKVAATLTHFKMGTSARDWASDCLATALGVTPITYGTWADFKTKFKEQFIPPQT